jgi:hypothetical protein
MAEQTLTISNQGVSHIFTRGVLVIQSTAGTVGWSWGQQTAGSDETSVMAGSYIRVLPL